MYLTLRRSSLPLSRAPAATGAVLACTWTFAACPKVDLNAETKFLASVGVVTRLCAARFPVRFLVGTRGISHLQNDQSDCGANSALIRWEAGEIFPRGGGVGGGKEVG